MTILAFVVLLGVLILVHEWGHFVVAKSFGVRVDVFSIGFGPRIWGWKRGHTDYRLSILPLGGYVKMAGDNPVEERTGAPDEFLSKPRWQRALIALAGPAMNIVLAIVLLIGVFSLVGIPFPKFLNQPVQIAGFGPEDQHVAKGLQPGDRVLEIGNLRNPTWEQAISAVQNAPAGEQIAAVVERGGETHSLVLTVHDPKNPWQLFGDDPQPAVIETVIEGNPASRAGMKQGDRVVSVNGTPVVSWEGFTRIIKASNGQMLTVVVERDGRQESLEIQPESGRTEDGTWAYLIGVQRRIEVDYRPVALPEATREALTGSWMIGTQIVRVVGGLLQGRISIRQLGGPIEIARQSGRAASEGLLRYIELMVIISLNLAVLNLLPIPILDGGHILLLAVEGTIRRDLSLRIKERFVQVGLVFLLMIFAVVMFNDVVKLLPGR